VGSPGLGLDRPEGRRRSRDPRDRESPQRIVGARGLDFEEDVVAPQKAARQMLEAAGLSTPAAGGGAASDTGTPSDSTSGGPEKPNSSASPAPSKNGAAARKPVTV
jgi:hypothetical protein